MPIQVEANKFTQFKFEPDYLQSKRWIKYQTNPKLVCDSMGIVPEEVPIKLDGGNVIKGNSWVIITDKVVSENKHYSKTELIKLLEVTFNCRIIIIPKEPGEMTGHADGIVRHYTDDTVLINSYKGSSLENYHGRLKKSLNQAGLKTIEVPNDSANNVRTDDAAGLYINFLQMEKLIIIPTYECETDKLAVELFETLYPSVRVHTINSIEIARLGGVLNCISWNIRSKLSHPNNSD
jgi:agmatine deiminase